MPKVAYFTCQACGCVFRREGCWAYHNYKFCGLACRSLTTARASHPDLYESYFEIIDTPSKAYWLGFLYADGNITDPRKSSLIFQLSLAEKDEGQLDRFITAVGANPSKKSIDRRRHVFIHIGNRIFCEHLVRQGCTPRKTKSIQFRSFQSQELDLAFLLGYFDGDGSLSKQGAPEISSGCRAFLESARDYHGLSYAVRTYSSLNREWHKLYIGHLLHRRMIENYRDSMPRKRQVAAT